MERKVGEIFEIDGVYYCVEIETRACKGCCLRGALCKKSKSIRGECQSANRKEDGVIFVKIKNMEERTIKLTLEKAREFYEKGDEFRDLALSAFTKEELIKKELPKTWKEFCDNYPIKDGEYAISNCSTYYARKSGSQRCYNDDLTTLSNSTELKKHLALMQLHQLRDCYRQGWKPDYTDREIKYSIIWAFDGIHVHTTVEESNFLTFQSLTITEGFLNNFRDLIKQAGDLI